jgi:hypothetical protein
VAFISRGGVKLGSDYCVNGKRCRVEDDGTVYAYDLTAADVEELTLYFLREYARYCAWHVEKKHTKPEVYGEMVLQPFNESWPLRGRSATGTV